MAVEQGVPRNVRDDRQAARGRRARRLQAADRAILRHLGVDPAAKRILALKSSVHFRADFEPIAREVLVVAAPGPAKADPTMFEWTRLRKGLRLKPGGPAFAG